MDMMHSVKLTINTRQECLTIQLFVQGSGDDYSLLGDIFNTALAVGNAIAPAVNAADWWHFGCRGWYGWGKQEHQWHLGLVWLK